MGIADGDSFCKDEIELSCCRNSAHCRAAYLAAMSRRFEVEVELRCVYFTNHHFLPFLFAMRDFCIMPGSAKNSHKMNNE